MHLHESAVFLFVVNIISVVGGGHADLRFEKRGKIMSIGELQHFCDLGDGQSGISQQRTRHVDSLGHEILVGRDAEILAKQGDETSFADKEILHQIVQRDLFTDVQIQKAADTVCQIVVRTAPRQLPFDLQIFQHLMYDYAAGGIPRFQIQCGIAQNVVDMADMLFRLGKRINKIRVIHIVCLAKRTGKGAATVEIYFLIRVVEIGIVIQTGIGTDHVKITGVHRMYYAVHFNVPFAAQHVLEYVRGSRVAGDKIFVIRQGLTRQFDCEGATVADVASIIYQFMLNVRL